MKLLTSRLVGALFLASVVAFSSYAVAATASAGVNDGTPTLLTELLFNSAEPMGSSVSVQPATTVGATGWVIAAQDGSTIGVQSTASPISGDGPVYAVVGAYPRPKPTGGEYMWAQYHMASLNSEDVYIDFWAKMPDAKEGFKFVKIFGQDSTQNGVADATFATNYTGGDFGSIHQISFGDGSTLVNDSQQVINFDGTRQTLIGRSYGTASVLTPQMSAFSSADWGTGWHHFRIHVKFNSGTSTQNAVPNGEYYLEIDGKIYVDATGLYNRNPANGPIDSIGFFGWAQTDPSAFQAWYYDVQISTGGFITGVMPSPPTRIAVN